MEKLLLILSLFIYTFPLLGQDCDCVIYYDWAKQVIEENDAGFQEVMDKKGRDAYTLHNALIEKELKEITDLHQCIKVLRKWIYFFRKNHIDIVNINTPPNSKDVIFEPIQLDEFKEYLRDKQQIDIEGVWDYGGTEIVFKKVENQYYGVINKSNNDVWKKGEVQFIINEEGTGDYFNWEKSKWHLKKYELISKDLLKINSNIYLRRVFMHTEADSQKIKDFIQLLNEDAPFAKKINDETYYLRLPSFDPSQKEKIDSVLLLNGDNIKRTRNLIVDVRSNGGGFDKAYEKLLPMLYTNPIRKPGFEFLSTKLNNQRTQDFINGALKDLSEDEIEQYKSNYKTLSENLGQYVNFDAPETAETIILEKVYDYPEKVSILIDDEVASSAEEFLLASKQSMKVKVYGIPTMGALDVSNQYYTLSPDKEVVLVFTLSRRIDNMSIDDIGIQPDFFLDSSTHRFDWIEYVTKRF